MLHLGFITELVDGHVTHELNLRRYVAKRDDVVAHWFPVAGTAPDLWDGLKASGLKMGLRARSALRTAKEIDRCDAVLAHSQNAMLFAPDLMRRIPTVVSTDASPIGFHEFAAAYDHKIHAAWIERMKALWNRHTFAAAAKIVSMSDWARRGIIEHYGIPESMVETIPNGVDTELWRPAPERKANDGIVRMLFIGGNFLRKGGDLLLRWAQTTSAKGWELHVVTTKDMPAPKGVHVHHFANNSGELVELAQSCDVFVLPTRGDCSPFACLEAMAAGLPVITTSVGGVPELVVEGVSGFVIRPDDFDALHERIAHMLASPQLCKTMGAAARRRAVERYDVGRNCRRIVDVLTQVSAAA